MFFVFEHIVWVWGGKVETPLKEHLHACTCMQSDDICLWLARNPGLKKC